MVEKIAGYLGVSSEALIIGVAFFVVAFIIIWIKITIDEKKGVNSQEKADIRKIIDNLVPDGQDYIAVYAHSKEVYGSRTMRREVYHYYAVGFRPDQTDHLWVVPIGVEGGKIVYTQPRKVCVENMAFVGGNEHRLELHFARTQEVYILSVDASNTKLGKECQVNIQQEEEAKAFKPFGKAFQEYINASLGVNKKGYPLKK